MSDEVFIDEGLTHEAIAKKLGISIARVRQIEMSAIMKLKTMPELKDKWIEILQTHAMLNRHKSFDDKSLL